MADRNNSKSMPMYSQNEERANWITHGLAVLLSLMGSGFMCFALMKYNHSVGVWLCVGVYLISLLALYTASTLYHFVKEEKWKHIFRVADHSAIYSKIAGTYTPFLVLAIPDQLGYELLMALWLLAGVGVLFKIFFVRKLNFLSTLIYLGMGWMALGVIVPLFKALQPIIFWLIIAGGIFFTVGVIFYLLRNMRYSHAIWHGFVMVGSACHFSGIYLFLSTS